MLKKIRETTCFIKKATGGFEPICAMVLGSGLGRMFEDFSPVLELPYGAIPNFPVSTVKGHEGKLSFGYIENSPVVILSGRFHYYEGYPMEQVVFPVRVMGQLGVRNVFFTNAAGGIHPGFRKGDLVVIRDHLNFMPNPLVGYNDENLGPRFPDMSQAYNRELIDRAQAFTEETGMRVHIGCYVGLTGPSFETPAEYQAYRILGGDMIGMSTVPEVIAARHMGLRCFAVSVITNIAVPGHFNENSHQEVLDAAAGAGKNLSALLKAVLRGL